MSTRLWQEAFLGVSAVLGQPLDESLRALPGGPAFHPPELLRALGASSRQVRAQAIARALAAVVVALEELRLE